MSRLFLLLGALNGLLAVGFGAFGAHGLRARVTPDLLAVWNTGAQYHMYHALALLAVAVFAAHYPDAALLRAGGWLFLGGIVVFSGSLYLLAFTGLRWLGAVTPLGGVAFLAGWACLALFALRLR